MENNSLPEEGQNSNQGQRITVDTAWMKKWYDEFNRLYWNSELPEIEFETCNTAKCWGRAVYSYTKRGKLCFGPLRNFKIYLSNYHASTEFVKKNTLLHEMIHIADYYFHPEHFIYNDRKVSRREYDAHGPVFFLKEAARLKQYGWDIQKFVSAEEKEQSELTAGNQERLNTRIANAVAAVLVYVNHKFIVKTDVNSMKTLQNHILDGIAYYRANGLDRIEYYHSHSEWFNSLRSCKNQVRGWNCATEEEYRRRANKWSFDTYPFTYWRYD